MDSCIKNLCDINENDEINNINLNDKPLNQPIISINNDIKPNIQIKKSNSFNSFKFDIKNLIKKDTEIDLNINKIKKSDSFTKKKLDEKEYMKIIKFINKQINEKIELSSNILFLPKSDFKIIGFDNIGHSCYMNSFLQILFHTPKFLKELKEIYNNNKSNETIDLLLIKTLIDLSMNPKDNKKLKSIKKIMSTIDESYGNYIQNDSQEFGISLINKIITDLKPESPSSDDEEEVEDSINNHIVNNKINKEYKIQKFNNYINRYYPKDKEIIFEKMFQFHESEIKKFDKLKDKNKINSNDSELGEIKNFNFETFINIELIIPDNIKKKKYELFDLLKLKYIPEFILTNDESLSDNKIIEYILKVYESIKEFINFFKKKYKNLNQENNNPILCFNKIVSLPNILIITINRALLGKSFNSNILSFNETLDLKEFIDEDILGKDKKTLYRLYAINECFGFIKDYGHYYSYIKLENNWIKFDDKIWKNENPKFESRYVVGLYYVKEDFIQK